MQILQNGAIFISDAHLNSDKNSFLFFLKKLESGEIKTSQLFLMGDMFDFLSCTKYSQIFYKNEIEILNKLSQNLEIHYLEGNHDFNLKEIFPKIKIYQIKDQPLYLKSKFDEIIALSHGDIFLDFWTSLFLQFLRYRPFLKFMDFIDKILNYRITKSILSAHTRKKIDYKISNQLDFFQKRAGFYDVDIILEGHYHQNFNFHDSNKIYINLPCFAFHQSYFIVKYESKTKFIEQSL